MAGSRAPRAGGRMVEGITLGHYVLLEELGSGGMGVVYAALDPDLDRKVALKLLRNDLQRNPVGQEDDRQRLLVEAQSMARLSHPNVVTIHDVGTIDGRVYLAMEYIDGTDMRTWLEDAPHPWPAARRLLLQAGRGLAAAHAAGLVHRDFKPDNVLISTDGRAVVTDFGLARAHESEVEEEPSTSGRSRLTNPGVVMGTPAYMSPEQHRGQPVDPRSDQFSFCVVLYEALYGQRPFAGRTRQAIALQAIRGKIKPPPNRSGVPDVVRRALLRGLSPEPERRWPDMASLLAALQRDPAERKRWAIRSGLASAGLAGTVALLSLWPGDTPPSPVCTLTFDPVRETRERVGPIDVPGPSERLEAFEERLDRWYERWVAARLEACRASRVDGLRSARLLGVQNECLDQRSRELDATLRLLNVASELERAGALAVVAGLPDPQSCDDPELAQAEAETLAPLELEQRAHLAQLTAIEAMARVRSVEDSLDALGSVGHLDDGPAVAARATWLEGELRRRAGQHAAAEALLHRAAVDAAGREEWGLLTRVWTSLTALAADQPMRASEGERWARYASAGLARHGLDLRLAAELLTEAGRALGRAGRHAEAVAHLTGGAEAWQAQPDLDPVGAAQTQLALAEVALRRGDARGAVESSQQGLEMLTSALGDAHPALSPAELLAARCELALDRSDRARLLLEHARGLGPAPRVRFEILIELAHLALEEDERAGAEELLRGALHEPPPNVPLARARFLLGRALATDSPPEGEARELGLSALAELELASEPDLALIEEIDAWLGEEVAP